MGTWVVIFRFIQFQEVLEGTNGFGGSVKSGGLAGVGVCDL